MFAPILRAISACARRLPQRCVLCADPGGPDGLCDGCQTDLPWLPALHCPVCALPASQPETCGRCLRRPPAFDDTVAAFSYGFPVDGMIRRLKFHAALPLAEVLALGLQRTLRGRTRPDLLLPMPLARSRLRQRGFNQSIEIARPLARALSLKLELDACRRSRDTREQSGLSLAARRGNLRGAFECDARLSGADIAVLDDVMTSGTTLDELARTLKLAGARRVTAWVVARTPARSDRLSA